MSSTISGKKTKTREVVQHIEADIKAGVLSPGASLMSMRAMAKKFDVSVAVINSAYDKLTAKGLLVRQPRIGVRVSPKLKPAGTRLVALLTTYGRHSVDTEMYYNSLFRTASAHRMIPLVDAGGHGDWHQSVRDVIARSPDAVLIDLAARPFVLDELLELCKPVPVCFCNHWQWADAWPERAVLTDHAGAYAEALSKLRLRGHDRILVVRHASDPPPGLRAILEQGKAGAGFATDDPRLEVVSQQDLQSNPDAVKRIVDRFQPQAVFGMSDYPLILLEQVCPFTARLDRIGFYNTHHSRVPGREFPSFAVDFEQMWELAAKSFSGPPRVVSIRPKLLRWPHKDTVDEEEGSART